MSTEAYRRLRLLEHKSQAKPKGYFVIFALEVTNKHITARKLIGQSRIDGETVAEEIFDPKPGTVGKPILSETAEF